MCLFLNVAVTSTTKSASETFVALSLVAATVSLFALLNIKYALDQVKVKDTSQLINVIFSILQKLMKCFNGITILISLLFALLHC